MSAWFIVSVTFTFRDIASSEGGAVCACSCVKHALFRGSGGMLS